MFHPLRILFVILSLMFSILAVSGSAFAGSLVFQGVLEDTSTVPATVIGNASGLTISILYRNPGDSCTLASESFGGISTDSNGRFSVTLGTGSIGFTSPATTIDDVFNNSVIYGCYTPSLSDTRLVKAYISGGTLSSGINLSMNLGSTPFAVSAKVAGSAYSAGMITGLPACGPGMALRWDGAAWSCISGGGAVLSVAGKTGVVTLQSADITDAVSTNTANTLVKRDATGNFSAGTITANLVGNVSGSAASITGTLAGDAIGPQASTSVIKIQGNKVSNTAPSAGQVMTWNGGLTQWEPQTPSAPVIANTANLTNGKIWIGDGTGKAQEQVLSGDATVSNTGVVSLANSGVTAGTYAKVTVDAKGRATAGTILSASDVNFFAFVQGGNAFGLPAIVGTTDSYPLRFTTNSTNRMTIDTSGNVGVGTNTPASLLHVAQTGGATNTVTVQGEAAVNMVLERNQSTVADSKLRFQKSNGTSGAKTVVNSSDLLGSIQFLGYDGSAMAAGASITATVDGAPGPSDMPTRLGFSTSPDGSSTVVERMRIDNSGKVGIGTAAPAMLLDVAGEARFISTGLTCSGSTAGAFRYNSGSMEFCNGSAWTALGVGGGEINTASNQGLSGVGLFYAKSGVDLQFKNIDKASGSAITVTNNAGNKTVDLDIAANSGQILVGNGSNLARAVAMSGDASISNAGVVNVSKIQGYAVAATSPTTGQVMTWNGGSTQWEPFTIPAAISSLNGLASPTQTFSIGTSGLSPNWSSVGSVHTLNIPMANTASVSAGLLSNSDYNVVYGSKAAAQVLASPTGSAGAASFRAIVPSDLSGFSPNAMMMANGSGISGTGMLCPNGQILQSSGGGTFWACASMDGAGVIANGGNTFGSSISIGTKDNQALNLLTNNTARMTLTSGGSLGIGTGTPQNLVDIQGNLTGSTAYSSTLNVRTVSSTSAAGTMNVAIKGIMAPTGSAAATMGGIYGTVDFSGNNNNTLGTAGLIGEIILPNTLTSPNMPQSVNGAMGSVENRTPYSLTNAAGGSFSVMTSNGPIDDSTGVEARIENASASTMNYGTAVRASIKAYGSGGINSATGVNSNIFNQSTATIATAQAITASVNGNPGSTITTARGLDISVGSGGYINSAYGISMSNVSSSNDAYGIYIGSINAPMSKYSIYASDAMASSYFGGKIGIGIDSQTPPADLYISRNTSPASSVIRTAASTAGTSSIMKIQRSRGSVFSPMAVSSNDILGILSFDSYDGSGYGAGAYVQAVATESHTGSAHGSRLEFATAQNGSTTPSTRMAIENSGYVGINVGTAQTALDVNGSIRAGMNFIASGSTADMRLGNTVIFQNVGGSNITLTNMLPGSWYKIILEDTTSRTYTFTGCIGGTYYDPPNAATTPGARSVYDIVYANSGVCYARWTTGSGQLLDTNNTWNGTNTWNLNSNFNGSVSMASGLSVNGGVTVNSGNITMPSASSINSTGAFSINPTGNFTVSPSGALASINLNPGATGGSVVVGGMASTGNVTVGNTGSGSSTILTSGSGGGLKLGSGSNNPFANIVRCTASTTASTTQVMTGCSGIPASGTGGWTCNCSLSSTHASSATSPGAYVVLAKPGFSGAAASAANNIFITYSAVPTITATPVTSCICFN